MNKYLKNDDLDTLAELNKENYAQAIPFPNIYFDDFFNSEFLTKVLEEFPDLQQANKIAFDDSKQKKFGGKGDELFGPRTRELMYFLNSEPFLKFLQKLTGMKEQLIGDPYFKGGGQHEIVNGGFLKIHADFNKHPTLGLDRRVNVLVYLNKNWEEKFGGHFELWDQNMEDCKKRILPLFNTMAIFSTTDFSFHGHPDPLNCPPNQSRKSLALYYYSNGRPSSETNTGQETHSTIFKKRKNVGNADDGIDIKLKSEINFKSLIREICPPVIIKIVKYFF